MCCLSLKVVKCVVILLNILYVITGLMLLITGIVMMVSSEYEALLPNIAYLNTAYLLIFIGIVIFISAVIGCCLRDTKCCVLTFYFLVVFVICLEVSVIIIGYIGNGKLRERIDDYSKQEMISDMVKYNNDNEIRTAWDKVQREKGCCGVREPSDWYNGIYGDRPFKTNQIPNSCCSTDVTAGCGQENVIKHAKVSVFNRLCPYLCVSLLFCNRSKV
ncbi:leukocyte surface antigen CD53-like isoform X2 [Anneissia japonica]|uniref:leukocyte surface antigen CD53-like isoform X2 n=1 Tax=Anneissia japonica TaxID=1529436 RepID=UPI0014257CC3|nr:leukocyte surface antigen CD53-like isoform X2 [Anneissia japonica]